MPAPRYYDAHCHWQDNRLQLHGAQIADDLRTAGLMRAVVNGTCPQDWPAVAALALADKRVLPAFGLHPWHVNAVCEKKAGARTQDASRCATAAPSLANGSSLADRSSLTNDFPLAGGPVDWLDLLKNYLVKFPQAAVGEIGLDNWIEGADKALQQEAFLAQLALAAEGNRPVSIHCLRADGDLLAALKVAPRLPRRGIHLHGFAGSTETARQLLDIGAYFSFSEYIATPKRVKARALAEYIPLDRLLVETDAPDMIGPPEWQHYRLDGATQPESIQLNRTRPAAAGKVDNAPPTDKATPQLTPPKHPANITAAYACLAQLRNIHLEELSTIVENNFLRYFGR